MRCLLNIFDIHPCQNSTHKWLKYFLKTIKRLFPKIHGFSCLWRPGAQKTALGTRSARHSLPEFIKTSAWLCLILIDSLSCRSRGTENLPTPSILKWNSVLPPWCTVLWKSYSLLKLSSWTHWDVSILLHISFCRSPLHTHKQIHYFHTVYMKFGNPFPASDKTH